MTRTLTFARLGQTMTEGTLLEWCVSEGESYCEGDVLYVVDTTKSSVDVEATSAGVMIQHLALAGDELEVGHPMAIVEDGA